MGNMAVCWMDYKDSPYGWTGGIWCRVSQDGGQTWSEHIRVNENYLGDVGPTIVVDDDFLAVTWTEVTLPVLTLHYRESSDFGATWGEDQVLDYGQVFSPRIAKDGDTIHLIWRDDVLIDSSYFVSFVRYMQNDLTTGTWHDLDNSENPESPMLVCYPNPFNSSVHLTITNSKGGDEIIEIYDLGGRLVRSLNVAGGKATWDATDSAGRNVTSGVYFARLTNSANDSHIKLIYLK